ncbi:hypothetical protein T07_5842 [Trichinella nelsoni]|uniref:Uncharacterized protein n=1 Tax=Trichinella nelsoni TaxID=6336 RepID=A0A0V0RPQ1_9BILA|nr:hypothetical protein T07_5842 [Trichinella nelsoni]
MRKIPNNYQCGTTHIIINQCAMNHYRVEGRQQKSRISKYWLCARDGTQQWKLAVSNDPAAVCWPASRRATATVPCRDLVDLYKFSYSVPADFWREFG